MRHDLAERARMHGALSDPIRLSVVDALAVSDRSSGELSRLLGVSTSLLAHHIDTLATVGIVRRVDSSADRRRRYIQLQPDRLGTLVTPSAAIPADVLFICTRNSARSQLAAAMWAARVGTRAQSAGTEPADVVHPRAITAARRIDLDISTATPHQIGRTSTDLQIITVCDRAHEELDPDDRWWHWSITDPADTDTDAAFDEVVAELDRRLRPHAHPTHPIQGDHS